MLRARRNDAMAALEAMGIATRQGTHAAALTGYYRSKYRTAAGDFPQTALAEGLSISLPLYPQMDASDQEFVAEALAQAWER